MDDLAIYTPDSSLDVAPRKIAELLKRIGDKRQHSFSTGSDTTYAEHLAEMIWDLAANGRANYLDGQEVFVEDFAEWLSVVKFLTGHTEGPVKELQAQMNVFKVYMGIDENRV